MAFKFEWLAAVSAEVRLTPGDRHILMHCGIFGVLSDGVTFSARQATIARNCSRGRPEVNAAIKRGEALGYLVKSQRREQGPGRHGGDQWTLTIPPGAVGDSDTTDDESCRDSRQQSPSAVGDSDKWCRNFGEVVSGFATSAVDHATPLPGQTDPHTVLGSVFQNGFKRSVPANEPQPPSDSAEIIDAEVIDDAPYGRCPWHGRRLDENEKCPQCELTSGGWRHRGTGT